MEEQKIIMLSKDSLLISECREILNEMNIEVDIIFDFTGLLLELQDNDYKIIIIDCSLKTQKCLTWAKLLRKIRPKIPAIFITSNIDKELGARLYEENIYHMLQIPVNKNLLKEVLFQTIINQETKIR